MRNHLAYTQHTPLRHHILYHYCNSLLIGLPKSRLAPLQSVLNAAARLIARIPRFSHISTFMTEQLQWLPISARIHFKIIFLVYKAFLVLAPSHLCKLIMRPLSAISDPISPRKKKGLKKARNRGQRGRKNLSTSFDMHTYVHRPTYIHTNQGGSSAKERKIFLEQILEGSCSQAFRLF